MISSLVLTQIQGNAKCIAFLKKRRVLPALQLCGTDLPWVASGKHLGVNLDDKMNGMKNDMRIKRAQYITKNNDLCQEFSFCHPLAKFHLNQVYNSSFTGSPIWDLFSRESEMIEKSWNTSFRIMFDLPLSTHRFFVEPVSEKDHIQKILLKRFLGFLSQVQKSPKQLPRVLLNLVKHDARSTTGSNLRNIMLLTGKNNIEEVKEADLDDMVYVPVTNEDLWKIKFVKELINVREGFLHVENFEDDERNEVLEYLCSS